ncbi:anthranilate synthase component I family protein [Peribacillus cavernae]|uniref:Anthranilate synthase component I family protein n=1 Tax=Peribacillus cavernae TaxID=1674310 RepID=A0A433HGG8_9BACI|nr:anthranilate synthase component I family protein [Peribacillus cavernae]MDQ0220879.1 para-aminobenzoate synthetase component 1 [Peribacillus cavernae]RUQ27303.1 anthranilate synthase component I family protein [Peribacillus cavernae]
MEKQREVFAINIPFDHNDVFHVYKILSSSVSTHMMLESGRGGRFSMIGLNPVAELSGKADLLTIREFDGRTEHRQGNPLHSLKEWMAERKSKQNDDYPDFQSGVMGFISYDYVRYIENLPAAAKDDLETPDIYFLAFDEVIVYDHQEQLLWFMYACGQDEKDMALEKLESMKHQWMSVKAEPESRNTETYIKPLQESVSFTEDQFKEAVEKIKNYISEGDIFQVNVSVRQSSPLFAQPLDVYEQLRLLNPSPYMAYIHTPSFQIVSGSPELLVKKQDTRVSTRPIAGTRSRGETAEEDDRLARELVENEKERAEHVMLVDLERNDLGRVCEYGSVKVNEFMVIERYSHVMHIVSNVLGKLAEGKDAFNVIDAVFPGGTITGAPKVRTMEIIEELEPVRRGIYTGSIGWISDSGDMELNIVIRTMLVKDGIAHIQAGAGVVIDSNPASEYKESLKKAMALQKAKERAETETATATEKAENR